MKLLENKVALITGAGRGIGKAIALRFAQEGCNIAFTDIALNDVVMENHARTCGARGENGDKRQN